MSTVHLVEAQLARILNEMRRSSDSPIIRQYLAPFGFEIKVRLENRETQRKLPSRASMSKAWTPESGSIVISFEPQTEESGVQAQSTGNPVADLVHALDRVEARSGLEFVALKWFRDTVLPAEGLPWAASEATRGATLYEATEKGLVLTSRVPNPKQPMHPVTSIRLNRSSPEVRAILTTNTVSDFQPVEIKGEPLSATILRDRG
ncbi:MAG: hypothetical protein SFV51_05365 [Bryobacteraceae bacterium]|nr:hypothetical protein [Bryobacteraceae bacterium]